MKNHWFGEVQIKSINLALIYFLNSAWYYTHCFLYTSNIIIIIFIIIIILLLWEFFTLVLADGLSLESEWQQVSSSL